MTKKSAVLVLFSLLVSVLFGSLSMAAQDMATYSNSDYGFSFKYPARWTEHQPGDSSLTYQNDYFQKSASGLNPSHVVVSVKIPENKYKNTNLIQAYATVAVQPDIGSVEACKNYSDNADETKMMTKKRKIHANTFYYARLSGAAAGTRSDVKIYHTFYNNRCYEVNLNIFTGAIQNYPAGTKQVSKVKIWHQLETVLRTFKWTTLEESEDNVPADWQTYKNDQYSFEFKRPNNWIIDTERTGSTAIVFVDNNVQAGEYREAVNFESNSKNLSLDQAVDQFIEDRGYAEQQVKRDYKIKIGGEKTAQIETNEFGMTYYMFVHKGTIFQIETQKNLFNDEVLKTFKFIKTSDNNSAQSDWQTYKNDLYSVSISYPKSWYAYGNANDFSNPDLLSWRGFVPDYDKNKSMESQGLLSLSVYNKNPDSTFDLPKKLITGTNPNEQRKDVTINGYKGVEIYDSTTKQTSYLFEYKGELYLFEASKVQLFDGILNTLRFF